MQLEVNNASLEFSEQGEGETVVFVHGSNGDYRTWQGQQEALSGDYKTLAYSRRYHYPNEKIQNGVDYSMVEHLDDLQALIESLDDKPVHLVGHSYGAFLGILLAIREPDLIRSLVLEEPPIFTLFISIPPKPQEILKLLLTRPRTAIAIIRFAVTGLNPAVAAAEKDDLDTALRVFASAVLGADTFNNLSEERLQQARENMFKAELLGSGFLPLHAADISNIHIPTLIINGANSPSLFHHFMDYLHELMPNSEHINISFTSHIVHEDNAEAYNKALLSFLQGN